VGGCRLSLRTVAISELDHTNLKAMPEVGFDLSSQSYHLIRHVLIARILRQRQVSDVIDQLLARIE
jgi:hypothetical protein